MKIERKITFVQPLVNLLLLLNIGGSGFLLVFLVKNSSSGLSPQTEIRLILVNIILLLLIVNAVNFLFRKLHRQPLKERPSVDKLTGLMTRQDFVRGFDHVLLNSSRSGDPLCLLMIDIDHFRRINEKHGQRAGDKILAMLSKSIQSVLRNSDTTCRWAGDQFLVVLKDCTIKDACRIAAKILLTVRQQQLPLGKETVRISTSIGVAQMLSKDSSKTLISRAETGLHGACDSGRDTYAIGYDWIILEYYSKPIF